MSVSQTITADPASLACAAPAILDRLADGDETIRCAAARALGAIGDPRTAAGLVESLLDEDPDVRADVMAALAKLAEPEHADAIRRSLEGDPTPEVKTAAIAALARLRDTASAPLLRRLALDRCEDEVNWEFQPGDWDDWLDVQIAAIVALGDMEDSASIPDILAARADEMGQALDDVAFAALGRIPGDGVAALLKLVRDPAARIRARALVALSRTRADILAPMSDLFATDSDPALRKIAVSCVDPESASAAALALSDEDAGVRLAAVVQFGALRSDLAEKALTDEDEAVRASALHEMAKRAAPDAESDLAANATLWARSAGSRLAATAAAALPRLSGDTARETLEALVGDAERPVEVRIAALGALGELETPDVAASLGAALTDRTRQIRGAALGALAARSARCADSRAVVAAAIAGRSAAADVAPSAPLEEEGGLGVSKGEDSASARIRITPDGEIETLEDAPEPMEEAAATAPLSTLESIQRAAAPQPETHDDEAGERAERDDEGDGRSRKAKRRVAVDGPEDVALDVRLIAMKTAPRAPSAEIEQALIAALAEKDASLRIAAFEALASIAEAGGGSLAVLDPAKAALADPEPAIRGHAARIVAACDSEADATLTPQLRDPDAATRAVATRVCVRAQPSLAAEAITDESYTVRSAALDSLLASGAKPLAALEQCLARGFADTLADALRQDEHARIWCAATLSANGLPPRSVVAALSAVALAARA